MTNDLDNVSAEPTNSPPIASRVDRKPGSPASRADTSLQDLGCRERPSADTHKHWIPDAERRIIQLPEQRTGRDLEANRRDATTLHRLLIRRRKFVSTIGLFLLVFGEGSASINLNYPRHFETTDDAFIAARQFSIAPKVPGYITAVP